MRSPDAQPQLAARSAAHASGVSEEQEEEKEEAVLVVVVVVEEVGVVDPRKSLLLEFNGQLFRSGERLVPEARHRHLHGGVMGKSDI